MGDSVTKIQKICRGVQHYDSETQKHSFKLQIANNYSSGLSTVKYILSPAGRSDIGTSAGGVRM